MERVATFNSYQSLLDASVQQQAAVSSQTMSVSSGLKSDRYSELEGSAKLVLDLEREFATAEAEAELAEQVSGRLEVAYSAMSAMTDTLTNFMSLAASGISGTMTDSDLTSFTASASALRDDFVAQANTQYAGEYVFSGTATDTAPVDLTGYPTQTPPSSTDTSYYQGNDEQQTFDTDDGRSYAYSFSGSGDGVEQAIRAMSLVADMTTMDTATFEEAYELAGAALEDLGVMQTEASMTATSLDSYADEQTEVQLYAEALLGDLKEVNVAEASAELTALETQLEASYSALSSALELSILDYL